MDKKKTITAVVISILSAVIIILLIAITVLVNNNVYSINTIEDYYVKNYSAAVSDLKGLEEKLGESLSERNYSVQVELFNDIYAHSVALCHCLSCLPQVELEVRDTINFATFSGNYCKGLCQKVLDGGELDSDDYLILQELHSITRKLVKEF